MITTFCPLLFPKRGLRKHLLWAASGRETINRRTASLGCFSLLYDDRASWPTSWTYIEKHLQNKNEGCCKICLWFHNVDTNSVDTNSAQTYVILPTKLHTNEGQGRADGGHRAYIMKACNMRDYTGKGWRGHHDANTSNNTRSVEQEQVGRGSADGHHNYTQCPLFKQVPPPAFKTSFYVVHIQNGPQQELTTSKLLRRV